MKAWTKDVKRHSTEDVQMTNSTGKDVQHHYQLGKYKLKP
jgi:hypothetical protein